MTTIREKLTKIERSNRRDMIRDRVLMVTLVCEELDRRNRPLRPAEVVHFRRLVLGATEHVLRLL